MPTHLNMRYKEIEDLWEGVQGYQNLADKYGIDDIFADNGGKVLQLAIATGLDVSPNRRGPDYFDRMGNKYEVKTANMLKQVTGFSTNHHVTHHTIAGYRSRRFVFALYEGITLMEVYLVDSKDLEPFFKNWEKLLKTRSHINNPKIPFDHVREVGTVMYLKDVPPPWAEGTVKEKAIA